MTLELSPLVAASIVYLLVLFLVAYTAERGVIPARITQHPLVYSLAMCVYATSWSYFGSVGYAARHGFRYLGIYLGVTLARLLAPVLWRPLLRLTRELQFTSLADVLAFRNPGQSTGTVVTPFMLAGSQPYLALQVGALVESAKVLSPSASPTLVGLGFCAVLIGFSGLFGARHLPPRERHEGLILAIAFESAVKLVAVGVWLVSGGMDRLLAWLRDLLRRVQEGAFRQDLYFRLRVVEILLPPLREREENLSALAKHCSRRLCREPGRLLAHQTAYSRKLTGCHCSTWTCQLQIPMRSRRMDQPSPHEMRAHRATFPSVH